MKIKKIAGQSSLKVAETPAWATHQDANLMRPKDAKNLQEEITELRQKLNTIEEEKKLLKANSDKYERRAKYTMDKF
jgi:polyhydroxyalkanoate synthesis regulator phasin